MSCFCDQHQNGCPFWKAWGPPRLLLHRAQLLKSFLLRLPLSLLPIHFQTHTLRKAPSASSICKEELAMPSFLFLKNNSYVNVGIAAKCLHEHPQPALRLNYNQAHVPQSHSRNKPPARRGLRAPLPLGAPRPHPEARAHPRGRGFPASPSPAAPPSATREHRPRPRQPIREPGPAPPRCPEAAWRRASSAPWPGGRAEGRVRGRRGGSRPPGAVAKQAAPPPLPQQVRLRLPQGRDPAVEAGGGRRPAAGSSRAGPSSPPLPRGP